MLVKMWNQYCTNYMWYGLLSPHIILRFYIFVYTFIWNIILTTRNSFSLTTFETTNVLCSCLYNSSKKKILLTTFFLIHYFSIRKILLFAVFMLISFLDANFQPLYFVTAGSWVQYRRSSKGNCVH